MSEHKKDQTEKTAGPHPNVKLIIGLSIGLMFGVAIGVSTDNLGLGMGAGLLFGLAIGLGLRASATGGKK